MDKDEILRLKQITSLAAQFKDVPFGQDWRPIEDENYQDVPQADCEEVSEEERLLAETFCKWQCRTKARGKCCVSLSLLLFARLLLP